MRKFHDASLRHEYYESFDVNSKNYMEKSKGTEAFLAEFDRLIGRCVRATAKGPRRPAARKPPTADRTTVPRSSILVRARFARMALAASRGAAQ